MRNLLRGVLAGYGAQKLGGRGGCGCFGTIVLFILLYWLIGFVI